MKYNITEFSNFIDKPENGDWILCDNWRPEIKKMLKRELMQSKD